MLRFIIDAVLVLGSFILQGTICQSICLADISPNLLIILTSAYGFMRGKKEGMLIGFFCGLLSDIFYSDILGLYALIYMYIGYVNGFFNQIFYKEDIKLPLILISLSDFAYGISIYVFRFLIRNRLDFGHYLVSIIIPEVVYTVFLTVIWYRLILFINKKLDRYEQGGENISV